MKKGPSPYPLFLGLFCWSRAKSLMLMWSSLAMLERLLNIVQSVLSRLFLLLRSCWMLDSRICSYLIIVLVISMSTFREQMYSRDLCTFHLNLNIRYTMASTTVAHLLFRDTIRQDLNVSTASSMKLKSEVRYGISCRRWTLCSSQSFIVRYFIFPIIGLLCCWVSSSLAFVLGLFKSRGSNMLGIRLSQVFRMWLT